MVSNDYKPFHFRLKIKACKSLMNKLKIIITQEQQLNCKPQS